MWGVLDMTGLSCTRCACAEISWESVNLIYNSACFHWSYHWYIKLIFQQRCLRCVWYDGFEFYLVRMRGNQLRECQFVQRSRSRRDNNQRPCCHSWCHVSSLFWNHSEVLSHFEVVEVICEGRKCDVVVIAYCDNLTMSQHNTMWWVGSWKWNSVIIREQRLKDKPICRWPF